ncbi:short-chain dehydrogenase [Chlorella sorokiniana]|uniref:3-dehydrosphinganine reductase n=1 Tax=Chlorella sorokiniana TaxID=3076 RepID=A0A2P6TL79_CHLSO|nr:short-chain dehydrogenase [Chlorella sorokiniana]|eukprot:PRW45034.1 short-chain dehydrogenase [Chlorella sorokiniana]
MLPLPAWGPVAYITLLAVIAPAALMGLWRRRGARRLAAGTHVLITGGSKGLGLALARQCAQRGCSVTVVARSQPDLDAALQQLREAAVAGGAERAGQRLQALSADTADPAKLKKMLAEAESTAGPVNVLICNAGFSAPGLFVEQGPEVHERQMRVNYLGTVHTVQAALPGMLERRQGRIVLVASTMAVLGFAGYSSYAPSKWAVRGLADCLHNELQGTGVHISVAYPPDTDTPGYATEMETKPALCKAVNAALGSELFSAEKVAKALLGGIEAGNYHLPSPDFGQNLLVSSMTGLSPKRFWLPLEMLLGPFMPLITSLFGWIADRAARRHNEAHGMPPRAYPVD